jgi:hypothetical protein
MIIVYPVQQEGLPTADEWTELARMDPAIFEKLKSHLLMQPQVDVYIQISCLLVN